MPSNLIAASTEQDPRPGQDLRLTSLSPRFDGERHQLYYDLLVRAIDTYRTFNVALTGAYGTGKSSILDQLRSDRPRHVVELSLSTIAPEAHEAGETDQENAATGTESRTNRIQKEIVKQLLYRVPTSTVPRSGFRRTSVPDRAGQWFPAVRWGLLISGVIFLMGVVHPLVESLFAEIWRQAAAYAILAGGVVSVAWIIASLLRSRPALTASVKTGPATVTLSKASETYFDEYLDEIVYFFQASKRNLVLIEDIDRFEDVQVFDTLRALNSLLNSSDQIGQRIVFIYAIRDSVFEQIGARKKKVPQAGTENPAPKTDRAKATLERANRTKFFDVIIPVVPFVSADNARDVMSEAMKSTDFEINPALIRLAARHVADMRLIHNIRNEFEVYRNRLVVPKDRVPGINDDLVFAIVLFKNTHLADFEKIRHQDSSLDRLYDKWRELVRTNLATATNSLTAHRQASYLERTAKARAAHLGELLLELRDTLADGVVAGYQSSNAGNVTVQLAGPATEENVGDRETWVAIASGQAQKITLIGTRTTTLNFAPDQLAKLLGASVDPAEWDASAIHDVESKIASLEAKIRFLRHHTWEALCDHPEFTMPAESDSPTARASDPPEGALSFDVLVEHVLESDLARDLVRHGFLTSHFALYASSYYGGHLGPAALEYIRRIIEPGTPDFSFELGEDDVVQVLREQGADKRDDAYLFSDVGVYNVSILDFLLQNRPGAATTVAHKLSQWGEDERGFVDTYMVQGVQPGALLAAMTPTWLDVVHYAAVEGPVDASTRISLLNTTLRALPNSGYKVDDDVRQLIETAYRDLDAITQPGSTRTASIALGVVYASGAVLDSVEPLDDHARDVAIKLRLFPITEQNLRALAPESSIELDVLRGVDLRIYQYAVERIADYLTAFKASTSTVYAVTDPKLFATILTDAARISGSGLLSELITSASPACRVPALTDCPEEAWPFLVASDRTDPTFENVKAYIARFGVDKPLGILLTKHRKITGAKRGSVDERLKVAIAILAARRDIRAIVRVSLAVSLEPGRIPATSIAPESGDLVARLIKKGLLADDSTAFSRDLMVDWPTYEAAIKASKKFANFVSPDLLDVSQVPILLHSTSVPTEVARAVVRNIADYLAGAKWARVQEVAKALNERRWKLGYELIEALRAAGASNEALVQLIARKGNELDISQLKTLLRAMKAPYSQVADRGRGRPTFNETDSHASILRRLVGDTIRRVEHKEFKGKGRQLVAYRIRTQE
ncbi:hypothetical protein [Promicromonospora sp. NPDC090134]|uniref:YobI family P-loop NTPase n=1 Tax=Promicromonospora sp. NPDC090134 TaxID=3364408 RepID=UPI0038020016